MSEEIEPQIEIDPEATVAPEEEINAVIIHKVIEGTQVKTVVQSIGNVQVTEVQTLLELGVKAWRSQIGLS